MGGYKPWKATILLLLILLLCTDIAAQNSHPTKTLSGKYFVFCFPTNRGPPDRERTMNIQVYSTSTNITNISIAAPGISWYVQVTLDPNQMESVEAPDEVEADLGNLQQNSTIVITADHDIYVTAVSNVLSSSLAVFPIVPFESASGREFFVANYEPPPFYPSEIMITSSTTQSNVTVKKSPQMSFNDVTFPDNFQYHKLSDDEIGFLLSSNQSIQLLCSSDVTGMQVSSDYPVSVISGAECTYITTNDFDCDHIATYMTSVDRLGRQFTISPFAGRVSGYVYRIVAVRDDTNITIHSAENVTLNAGFYHSKDIRENDHVIRISSNKPVLVVQFAKGYTSDTKLGDPLMMVVPPEEQYVDSISFASFDMSGYSVSKNYLNLIIHCDYLEGVLFNGEEFNSDDWMDILTSGSQCVARRELVTSRVNRITHTSEFAKFVAFVYGVGNQLSYGHALDHSFTKITCTVPDGANQTKEVDCKIDEVDIYCPDDITQPTDAGMPTAVVTWSDVIANDTTGMLNVTSNYNSGDAFPIGTTEVKYRVEDSDGKIRASCSFYVTVVDEEKPSVICPENVTYSLASSKVIFITWPMPNVTDNSGSVKYLNSSHEPGELFPIGTTEVVYIVEDQSGNMDNCSFYVTLKGPSTLYEPPSDFKGMEFVFALPSTYSSTDSQNIAITVSSFETTENKLVLSIPGLNFTRNITVGEMDSETVYVPLESKSILEELWQHTIIIHSALPIGVIVSVAESRELNIFQIIPTLSLGKEYVTVSSTQDPDILHSVMTITAAGHDSNIAVTLPVNMTAEDLTTPLNASKRFFTLNIPAYNSIQLASNYDLTGTHVLSSNPITVISGSECINIPVGVTHCDPIACQLLPFNNLGYNYTLTPFSGRNSGYVYRVVAIRNKTIIFTSTSGNSTELQQGEFLEIDVPFNHMTTVKSNKPILVAQFQKGNSADSADDGKGDPSMIIVPPQEQYINTVSFPYFNTGVFQTEDNVMSVIIDCDLIPGLLLNGLTGESPIWNNVPDSVDNQCAVFTNLQDHGLYHVSHTSLKTELAVLLYGFGSPAVSYSYAIDFSLNNITCTILDEEGEHKELLCEDLVPKDRVDIYCPNNISQPTDAGMPTAVVTWPDVIANDTTGRLNVTSNYNSGDLFPIGTTEVTYWVENGNGEIQESCSFYVTVEDLERPIIQCPDNITKYTEPPDIPTVGFTFPNATDNSGYTDPVECNHQEDYQFPIGETQVECWTKDASENMALCAFFVEIEGVNITCPSNMEVPTDEGSPVAVVRWEEPIVHGGEDEVWVWSTHHPGDSFPIGHTNVTYVVYAPDNETVTSCQFYLIVTDEEAPILECSEDTTAYADGEAATPVEWIPPIPKDNSGHVSWLNSSHSSGDIFYIGNTVVTYYASDQAGNVATCSFTIIVIGRCPEDETENEELGLLKWPLTEVDSTAHSDLVCPIDTVNRDSYRATRYCSLNEEDGIPKWEPPEIHECGENQEPEIDDLPEVPVVEDNVQEVADTLKNLTDVLEMIEPDHVTDIADTLENIVEVEVPTEEVASSVVQIVGNLLEGDISSLPDAANSTSSIIQSLEHQIEITLENEGALRIIDPSIAVDALTINSTGDEIGESAVIGGLTFVVKHDGDNDNSDLTDERVKTYTDEAEVPEDIETTIKLPESLFSPLEQILGGQQVSFTVYQEDSLFISPHKKAQNLTVAGAIVSADILGESNTNLQEPVLIKFLPYQIPDITDAIFNSSLCVFWDFELQNGVGDWSTRGCTFTGIERKIAMCECTHLTSFAVLMNIDGHDMTGTKEVVLEVITYVGCALSILSLVTTLTIFLGFRKLRNTRQRIILIHFCFSLLFLYIVFISGVDAAVGSSVWCLIVAALIHYFTLTTMMWMGVEARNLYSKLVNVFDPEKDWFMIVAMLIAWGCPLVVVAITVGVGFEHYAGDDYCFIPPGPALYYGLILPIGLVLLHNIVTFAFIMHSLLKTRMKSSQVSKQKRKEGYTRLQNAITISVLLGVTWVFGFLAIHGAAFTFDLLFCLCNSLQGLFIFLLFCFRAEDVRKTLKPYFRWVKIPDTLMRTTTYEISDKEQTLSSSQNPVSMSTFDNSFAADNHASEWESDERVAEPSAVNTADNHASEWESDERVAEPSTVNTADNHASKWDSDERVAEPSTVNTADNHASEWESDERVAEPSAVNTADNHASELGSDERVAEPSTVNTADNHASEWDSDERVAEPSTVNTADNHASEWDSDERVAEPSAVNTADNHASEWGSDERVAEPSSVNTEDNHASEMESDEKVPEPSLVNTADNHASEWESDEKVAEPSAVNTADNHASEWGSDGRVAEPSAVNTADNYASKWESDERVAEPSAVNTADNNASAWESDERVAKPSPVNTADNHESGWESDERVAEPSAVNTADNHASERESDEKVSEPSAVNNDNL